MFSAHFGAKSVKAVHIIWQASLVNSYHHKLTR